MQEHCIRQHHFELSVHDKLATECRSVGSEYTFEIAPKNVLHIIFALVFYGDFCFSVWL